MLTHLIKHKDFKEALSGRYISSDMLSGILSNYERQIIGYSVGHLPISTLKIGTGSKKVVAWSQMHGNESTSTKALLDLFKFLKSQHPIALKINSEITFHAIPQLNPDGSNAYTRANRNDVDLNRDALSLSQPESNVLRNFMGAVNPDYAFNLHDQRSIYNVRGSSRPASLSFLAPSADEAKSITAARRRSMSLIGLINADLQKIMPDRIGRYDDTFNLNCTGDMFTSLNIPVLLFESGHYDASDYSREMSRRYTFYAYISGLTNLSNAPETSPQIEGYFKIPENEKRFFDVLIKNSPENETPSADVGILFEEVLADGAVKLVPKVEKTGDLSGYYGHLSYEELSIEESLERAKRVVGSLLDLK